MFVVYVFWVVGVVGIDCRGFCGLVILDFKILRGREGLEKKSFFLDLIK